MIFAAFFLFAAPVKKADAGIWGETAATNFGIYFMDQLMIILSELGKVALNFLSTQSMVRYIGQIATGDSVAFITEYEQYLKDLPENKAYLYAESFLTRNLHGRTIGNFNYEDGINDAFRSFDTLLYEHALGGIPGQVSQSSDNIGVDYNDYCLLNAGEPLFFGAQGAEDFTCFGSFFSNTNNHPEGLKLAVENAFTQEKLKQEKIAETEAIVADGVLSQKDSSGNIVKPAFAAKNLLQQSQERGFDSIIDMESDHWAAQVAVRGILPVLEELANKKIEKELNKQRRKLDGNVNDILKRIRAADPNQGARR